MVQRIINSIRAHRLSKNYSQEYVASKLDFSQSYYARIESGKVELSVKHMVLLFEILEIDYVDFFKKIRKEKNSLKILRLLDKKIKIDFNLF
ncbi:MAG: helix-turn-helix transcriptional regulator [Flavobacterium sp. JAD_PAG50586_2]|nr:MAG: helix-turn-helix transcriptional regulator [Flavobacterium sp. JAD_PAG50586_2]